MSDRVHLHVRVPFGAEHLTLDTILARAWPEASSRDRERALDEGLVEVDERIVRDGADEVRPGATVDAEVDLDVDSYGMPDTDALERGEGWVVVDKPRGMPGRIAADDPMHPIYFLADRLGLDRETFTPVWPMPTTAGGPWLFTISPERAETLRARWRDGTLMTTWVALVPRPEVPEGTLHTPAGERIQYSATNIQEGLAELQLTVGWEGGELPDDLDPATTLREQFADEGCPIVGDRRHGGFLPGGGLRLRLAALFDPESDLQYSWQPPDDWWPSTRVVPEESTSEPEPAESIDELDLPELIVKSKAIERLRNGSNPWIRPTEIAGRQDHFRAGTLVRTRGTNDVPGPVALIDDRPDVAARIWSDDPLDAVYFEETIAYRVDRAVARRAELFRNADQTDLFRLVHGEADGLPGLAVDRIGPILRARLDSGVARIFREEVYDALCSTDRSTMIVEVASDSPLGHGGGARVRTARAGARLGRPDRPVVVRERGRKYRTNPWSVVQDVDPSHRPTRSAAASMSREGDRWLVAAAPTTALPVPLACERAAEIAYAAPDEEVGISEMLRLNGADPGTLRALGPREILSALLDDSEVYDGIAVDLGIGSKLVEEREDETLDDLVEAVVRRAGSCTIAFAAPEALEESVADVIEGACDRTGIEPSERTPLTPPSDFPHLEDFDRGTPYRGLLLEFDRPAH